MKVRNIEMCSYVVVLLVAKIGTLADMNGHCCYLLLV